jgi:transcriptional regulator with XRE-family HTH domain
LRKLSDWVYSHSNPHAESRFNKVLYLFSPGLLRVFWTNHLVTIEICIDINGIYTAKLLPQQICSEETRSGLFQNLMATTLAPVDSREVLRCDHCHLVQFRTNNNLCRKCHLSLDAEIEEPEPIVAEAIQTGNMGHGSQIQVATAIRSLRLRSGLSQRQLALRMQVPRTYVSKIENDKATPTLSSLQRLATALEISVTDLLEVATQNPAREAEIRELMSDEFISELAPFISKLDAMQRSSFLTQVRELTTRPRRSA